MSLGAFSTSLNVKDLAASIAFYKTLGFETFHDNSEHNYAILKDGDTLLGLFQGHIPANTLTFNPGWDHNAQPTDGFEDVRDIQKRLQDAGFKLEATCDPATTGPAHIMLLDPDDNPILIDQHR
ncbi:catechol 2,3-dioxygenase-like lactoylglutathione lyase family enzyme [Loktanella ponticola]|uniref:Catechol 2,3-dioxygenase-like lactoylglutathione lyase family enzyme n=1 Tax=Yoonia ponticola TaxID=1524255 RepID=A0A7W9BHL5_9RHOB|nr:VOC family protein [Yoonia ponticola]MBB5720703.1 catechol 2,3-dioxygenase-like lactoylglutathione lyase family enzyme [Yoonia ponticola]